MAEKDILKGVSQVLMTTVERKEKQELEPVSPGVRESFEKTWLEAVRDLPVPSWCDSLELAKVLARETEEYYIEKKLTERLERLMKLSRNVGEYFVRYSQAIDDYSEAMITVLKKEYSSKPIAFYRSDLPSSLLTKLDLLKHTQIQAYTFLKKWIGSFVFKAGLYKGNTRKFSWKVEIPCNKKIDPLVLSFNSSEKASSALLAYIRIWNAQSYEELLENKPLARENLDNKIFSELYQKFEDALYALRNKLLALQPEIYQAPQPVSATSTFLGRLLLAEAVS